MSGPNALGRGRTVLKMNDESAGGLYRIGSAQR